MKVNYDIPLEIQHQNPQQQFNRPSYQLTQISNNHTQDKVPEIYKYLSLSTFLILLPLWITDFYFWQSSNKCDSNLFLTQNLINYASQSYLSIDIWLKYFIFLNLIWLIICIFRFLAQNSIINNIIWLAMQLLGIFYNNYWLAHGIVHFWIFVRSTIDCQKSIIEYMRARLMLAIIFYCIQFLGLVYLIYRYCFKSKVVLPIGVVNNNELVGTAGDNNIEGNLQSNRIMIK